MESKKLDALQSLVYELSKLPSIGEKTAMRLADHILKQPIEDAQALAQSILQARKSIRFCDTCFNTTDTEKCATCSDPTRDFGLICVVERPADARSLEHAGFFKGTFHVLHGVLSPLDGIGPDQLRIRELLARVSTELPNGERVREVVLALNPSTESDATTYYITRLLKPFQIRVTQLAQGIPSGGHLQYSDRSTIGKALENRTEVKL